MEARLFYAVSFPIVNSYIKMYLKVDKFSLTSTFSLLQQKRALSTKHSKRVYVDNE